MNRMLMGFNGRRSCNHITPISISQIPSSSIAEIYSILLCKTEITPSRHFLPVPFYYRARTRHQRHRPFHIYYYGLFILLHHLRRSHIVLVTSLFKRLYIAGICRPSPSFAFLPSLSTLQNRDAYQLNKLHSTWISTSITTFSAEPNRLFSTCSAHFFISISYLRIRNHPTRPIGPLHRNAS